MPVSTNAMSEALTRVSTRHFELQTPAIAPREIVRNSKGKLLMMMSAKGGAGVTTIACGLAVSLARDFGQRTLLIDLNVPLGDAALSLGLRSEYSTPDALQNIRRLDSVMLSSLVVRHESGLCVLPAPSEMTSIRFEKDAVLKLLRIARQEFEYVVVDAGSRCESDYAFILEDAVTIYLVTQIGIPELRNSNRLIKHLLAKSGPTVEVVVNRYDSKSSEIDDGQVRKALTQPIKWRVPNDYMHARRMHDLGNSFNGEDTEIASAIRGMGESATGLALVQKKKRQGIF